MSRHWKCPDCSDEIFTQDESGLVVLCGKCAETRTERVEMNEILTDDQIEKRIEEAKACRAELSREGGSGDICALLTSAIKDAEAELARRREKK